MAHARKSLLRVALVVLLLGTVLVQVLLPVFASDEGRIFPEVAYLVVPYSVAAILFIGCGQVALLAVWRLLSMVNGGVIFTRRALRWGRRHQRPARRSPTVLTAGVLIHMLDSSPAAADQRSTTWPPASPAGWRFVLLMVVMRGLLESAVADRTELDEVI